jgi:hypothetical protein
MRIKLPHGQSGEQAENVAPRVDTTGDGTNVMGSGTSVTGSRGR